LNALAAMRERYPSHLLANAFVNAAWRNGPIEDLMPEASGAARSIDGALPPWRNDI